jgi:hypothetical protein
MTIIRRFVQSNLSAVGDREFGGNAASADMQSDGWALDLLGGDLSRLQTGNAPLLWTHDTNSMLGSVISIRATATELPFRAKFMRAGANPFADQKCLDLKGGAGYGVSLAFKVDEQVLFDPSRGKKGGYRATKWTALELSLCSMPVDPAAVITERARRAIGGLQSALNACDRAATEHRGVGRHHGEIGDELGRLDQHRQAAGTALRGLKRSLDAQTSSGLTDGQSDDPYDVGEGLAQCQRSMDGMNRSLKAISDRHDDATDAHGAMQRALREVATAYGSGGPAQEVSGGLTNGQSTDRARRQRQSESLALAHPPHGADWERRQRESESLALRWPKE